MARGTAAAALVAACAAAVVAGGGVRGAVVGVGESEALRTGGCRGGRGGARRLHRGRSRQTRSEFKKKSLT